MKKKITALLIICMNVVFLTGCWNYKEVESTEVVAGFAVDLLDKIDAEGNKYHVTIDMVDMSGGGKEQKITSKFVEADGKTVFDATRNTIKRMSSNLSWANAQVIVISQDVAKDNIIPVIDVAMRNIEIRPTIELVVSQEKTAKEVLSEKPLTNTIASFEIDKEVENGGPNTATSIFNQAYQNFNTLASEGSSLYLPVIHNVFNDKTKVPEVNGIALFKKDKLVGFLNPNDTKYLLFANDKIKQGILTGKVEDNEENITLEVYENKTKVTPIFKDDKLTMEIKTNTITTFNELGSANDVLDESGRKLVEQDFANALQDNITRVVKMVQTQYGTDVFGFGETVHKKNPKLWKKLKDNWDETFKTLDVEVKSEINIRNNSIMKKPVKVGDSQ